MRDSGFPYVVSVTLRDNNNIAHWNRICIDAVELFGIPGDRFITDLHWDKLDFYFKNTQDELLFRLKFSEVCI